MRRLFLCSLFACVLAVTAACESTPYAFSDNTPQIVAAPDAVSARLAEAATRASSALETLAAVEAARETTPIISAVENAPPELLRAVTVNWVGPVEPIMKSLADRAGYTFETFGNAPPNALVIELDVENQPAIEVMRDVGLQLGNRADVRVHGRRQSVELHYVPVTSGRPRGIRG